ncbi:hypothetical protein [Paracoccus actinidiae]|uniref:hypothetical protein n=1 Tax=Paracoccus actinidiae TaxID=3064531 RepID=UPI0027D3074E|nr:hypothetical protein [Paracoccus sp. M09]
MTHKASQTQTSASEEMANVLETMKPRLKASIIAKLSGLSQRVITQHATNNCIPGAAKHGGLWTFDHDLALLWINEGSKCQEVKQTSRISSSRTTANSTGSVSKSTASHTENRFEQLLKASRRKGPKAA